MTMVFEGAEGDAEGDLFVIRRSGGAAVLRNH